MLLECALAREAWQVVSQCLKKVLPQLPTPLLCWSCYLHSRAGGGKVDSWLSSSGAKASILAAGKVGGLALKCQTEEKYLRDKHVIPSAGLEGWERRQKERWVINRGAAQEGASGNIQNWHSMTTSTSWFDHSHFWFQVPLF